jgi:SAM-dependent methyltransferase
LIISSGNFVGVFCAGHTAIIPKATSPSNGWKTQSIFSSRLFGSGLTSPLSMWGAAMDTNEGIREKVSFQGVDISGLQVEYARRVALGMGFENVQFEAGSAEHLGFPDESFDIVLCSDVVEHLENPEKCFAEIRRVLKSGGTAIITTPNPSSTMIKLASVLRSAGLLMKPQVLETAQDGGHISLQGLNEWIQMAKETGFEVRAVRRGALLFGGHAYNRRPMLFALVLLADRLLDFLPAFGNWGEAVTLKLVKP